MKKFPIILVLLTALLACCLPAKAQLPTYAPQTLTNSIGCAASAAVQCGGVIDCRKQNTVAVQITQGNDAAGTANVNYFFLKSVDGQSYETTPGQLVSVAANGTTAVTITTNLNTQGVGYIKLAYITNAAASANCSSNIVKYSVKISSP